MGTPISALLHYSCPLRLPHLPCIVILLGAASELISSSGGLTFGRGEKEGFLIPSGPETLSFMYAFHPHALCDKCVLCMSRSVLSAILGIPIKVRFQMDCGFSLLIYLFSLDIAPTEDLLKALELIMESCLC